MRGYRFSLYALITMMSIVILLQKEQKMEVCYLFLFVLLLAGIAFIDLCWMIIPDVLVLVFFLMALPLLSIPFSERMVAAGLIIVITAGLRLWKGNCLGWGDVKLSIAAALAFGYSFLSALRYSIVASGVTALLFLLFRQIDLQTRLPFAPWIVLAVLLIFL